MNTIHKYNISKDSNYYFSVIIPTWNNIDYLKLCIQSIQKNSSKNIQIIVWVNEGSDSTLEWLKEENTIDYIHSETNMGICYALNLSRPLVKANYIIYMNDDMYVLPNWDAVLAKQIEALGHKYFMFSSTMVEPFYTNNPCVVVKNYGTTISSFKEEELLADCKQLVKKDWNGSSKLYEYGVRIFKGCGESLVYHFGSKSTKRLKKSKGRKLFISKWSITAKTFYKNYLKMGSDYNKPLEEFQLPFWLRLLNKLKHLIAGF